MTLKRGWRSATEGQDPSRWWRLRWRATLKQLVKPVENRQKSALAVHRFPHHGVQHHTGLEWVFVASALDVDTPLQAAQSGLMVGRRPFDQLVNECHATQFERFWVAAGKLGPGIEVKVERFCTRQEQTLFKWSVGPWPRVLTRQR